MQAEIAGVEFLILAGIAFYFWKQYKNNRNNSENF